LNVKGEEHVNKHSRNRHSCFVILILNVVFLAIIFFMRRRMATVSQWPSVMGPVMMSTIELRSSSEGGSTEYPVVQYSY